MRALRAVLLLILCAAAARSADISGQWKAEWREGRDPAKQSTFTFKQDGATLTGTLSGEGTEFPIRQGKVTGDDVTFVVVNKVGARETTLTYTGKVSGAEMKLTIVFDGSPRTWDMTATKVR
jgi:uncharacterized lipoprotein YehR (DUF1307 family)